MLGKISRGASLPKISVSLPVCHVIGSRHMACGIRDLLITLTCLMVLRPLISWADDKKAPVSFKSHADSFLAEYCTACHGVQKQKGEITLHDLGLDFESPEEGQRWMGVLNQLETGEMPPKKKTQPSHVERM